jgi:acetyl-CoA carboxylase biotin carboxyl carrier protein
MGTIRAPMPGIFYRRPDPEAEFYVEEGAQVAAGQTIGLLEVMKTFNEVKADTAGRIVKFFVANEEEVTIGQDLAEDDT